MINIIEKKDCCGCSACVSICPKHCITMLLDNEGFLYPQVDKGSCIDCELCEKVCLVLNQGEERKPLQVYAVNNPNEEIRMKSSSGGVFTLLAETIIQEGGVVFGARFNDDWEVIHDYTETKEGLAAFRGSKYVQSRIGESYCQVERFLKEGRKVLFTGTPCQIAGLNLFLRKEYDNLLTVDFICHGVPSPGVWKNYLEELIALKGNRKNSVLSHSKPIILNSIRDISRIEFRNKRLGWKKFSFALTLSVPDGHGTKNTVLLSEPYNENIFMKGFLADLYLRPSCYACPAKCLKSGSDITIGDYWGIQNVMPEIDDDKGICCLMVNTDKGGQLLSSMGWVYRKSDYSTVIKYNIACVVSVAPNLKRKLFFDKYQKTNSLIRLIDDILTPPLLRKGLSFAKRLVNKVFHFHKRNK
ncbi:Coenzyme F420 hydrogenase/dehydrogenase, beta subunit C-terminal domain [Parabacteroides johnsonii]|uniref:Coenzyme F420 hydrogenase/dehydrogenase, beta subunit C-terminal domain n=1 Tax=Parabacteroides johnsonii TaxID=387661 RepID=UPI0022E0A443|nr:Coenzyme F420 hydrogenase/dehydrogenase, beta subunit C-terminal domain [Parabacteroides johnsonii]